MRQAHSTLRKKEWAGCDEFETIQLLRFSVLDFE